MWKMSMHALTSAFKLPKQYAAVLGFYIKTVASIVCCDAYGRPLSRQVVLHFTAPIYTNTTLGSPVLLLRVDPTIANTTADAADDGMRYAVHSPGLTQFVDVGVDASR